MKFRRTILKQELAVKLFPDCQSVVAAMQMLRKEIRSTPMLKERLFDNDCNPRLHYFNHRQLEVLLEHFSITEDEFQKL